MKNKDKDILPLGTDFEVLEQAAPAAAQAAAPASADPRAPLRKTVSTGSIGLLVALAGLLSPYGAPAYSAVAALATAVVLWQLLSAGLGRIQPTSQTLKPYGAVLALVAGGLSLGLGDSSGRLGAILCVLGGLLSLVAPAMNKKADSKLPPAGTDVPVDGQFSKSLLAYLLVILSLPLAWTNEPGSTALATILGGLTFLFCLLSLWASWVGMWKLWAMPAISAGFLGLVLFLAPLEAVFLGLLGIARVFLGGTWPALIHAWPGAEDLSLLYLLAPLLCFIGGALATFELVQGAKKGLAANKQKKEAEIASRKAARAARRENAATPAKGKSQEPEVAKDKAKDSNKPDSK